MNAPRHDFQPTPTWEVLRQRADLLDQLRQFFSTRGFLEVDTPLLSADTVVDRHLDPVSLVMPGDPRDPRVGQPLWLQTSPEFAMKRLIAAGGTALYQITRAFRAAEQGPRHNPEFTIVEWYRAHDDLIQGMQLLSDLAAAILGRGNATLHSYRDLFLQHARIDPWDVAQHQFRDAFAELGIAKPEHTAWDDRDALIDTLLVECVEPHLGNTRPAIVYHYPPDQAALARLAQDAEGRPVAERFELYVQGVELANGYHELLDPDELLRRNHLVNRQRMADDKPALPVHSRLLDAMRHGLPACTGVALGFDRLLMVLCGAEHIRDVLPFPIDRA